MREVGWLHTIFSSSSAAQFVKPQQVQHSSKWLGGAALSREGERPVRRFSAWLDKDSGTQGNLGGEYGKCGALKCGTKGKLAVGDAVKRQSQSSLGPERKEENKISQWVGGGLWCLDTMVLSLR